jgi:hypothetical protein
MGAHEQENCAKTPVNDNRIEHPAFARIDSFQQGELDCLCGLYAILNGYRLALGSYRGFSVKTATDAFRQAISHLREKGTLEDAVSNGIGARRIISLAKLVADWTATDHTRVVVETAPHMASEAIEELFAWIEASLANGHPVIVYIDGEVKHWTTIGAIDVDKLYFFDSGDLGQLKRCDFGVTDHDPLQLTAKTMFRLKVVYACEGCGTKEPPQPVSKTVAVDAQS